MCWKLNVLALLQEQPKTAMEEAGMACRIHVHVLIILLDP